jgi:hypothetical protein
MMYSEIPKSVGFVEAPAADKDSTEDTEAKKKKKSPQHV